MSRITDLQSKLKKEQVEQFKLNEKLMERDNLILRLESHRQNLKFDVSKRQGN